MFPTSALQRSSGISTYSGAGIKLLWVSSPRAKCSTRTRNFSCRQRSEGRAQDGVSLPFVARRFKEMDNFLIWALVRAGTCSEHRKDIAWQRRTFSTESLTHEKKSATGKPDLARSFHQKRRSNQKESVASADPPTKEELKRLVDFYETYPDIDKDGRSHTGTNNENLGPGLDSLRNPILRLADPNGEQQPYQTLPPETEEDEQKLSELEDLLLDEDASHEDIYVLYRSLPSPRFSRLPPNLARKLIGRLSVIEYKKESHMIRFLSLLDDMKAVGAPIRIREWSTAIHLAGRCLTRPGSAEVENALYIWREMENEAGVRGNHVTFNILFDIATKASKFALAGMILREMQQRGLPFDRFFRTSTIDFHGAKRDADGVRRAYRALVDAGEIVDTTVLNAVISALLRSHEHAAAEHVFERMKTLHAQKVGGSLPPRSWRDRRQLGRLLDRAGRSMRSDGVGRADVQALAPIAPDRITFQLLLKHYAVVDGDLHRALALLAEMEFYGVPRNNPVFMHLFAGFAAHHEARPEWSAEALERLWRALVRQIEEDTLVDGAEGRVWWEGNLVECVAEAFATVKGRERAEEVWEEARKQWVPGEGEEDKVLEKMRRALVKGDRRWSW